MAAGFQIKDLASTCGWVLVDLTHCRGRLTIVPATMTSARVEGGLFQRLGVTRAKAGILFYCICIWVRFGVALGAAAAAREWPLVIGIVAAVLGVLSVIVNARGLMAGEHVWWHRQMHLVVGVAVVAVGVLVATEVIEYWALFIVLAADVVYGIIMSLIKRPFRGDILA